MQQELSPSLTQSSPGRHCEKSTHRSNMFPFPAGEHTGSELFCGMHCFPGPHTAPGLCGSHVKSPPPVVDGPAASVTDEGPTVELGSHIQGSYLEPSRAQYCDPTHAPGPLHSCVDPGTHARISPDEIESTVSDLPVDICSCAFPPSPAEPCSPFAHAPRFNTKKKTVILFLLGS